MTTVAAIAMGLPAYDAARIHHARVAAADVHAVTRGLLAQTRAERAAIGVMHPGRADVIGGGALVLDRLMQRFGFAEVLVSEHDISCRSAGCRTRRHVLGPRDSQGVLRRPGYPATLAASPACRQASGAAATVRKSLGRAADTVRIASCVRRHEVIIVPAMVVLEEALHLQPWQLPYDLFVLCASSRIFRTKIALFSVLRTSPPSG